MLGVGQEDIRFKGYISFIALASDLASRHCRS